MHQLKICIISASAKSIVQFRKELVEHMVAKSNAAVYVFAPDYTHYEKCIIEELGAIPVDHTLQRSGLNPLNDILATIQLKRKIAEITPDIVFSYFSKPVIFGTLAAKLAKIPRITGMLEGLGYFFTPISKDAVNTSTKTIIKSIQIFLFKLSIPLLDRIIFLNSDDQFELIEGHNIRVKSQKILGPIGVPLDKYKYTNPPTSAIRFIFIGRLLTEKGINEFTNAAKRVKQKYKTTEFIVLGGIDEKNPGSLSHSELGELIKTKIIEYKGHVSNVFEHISESSVFVLPSYREGFPRSTQEAMAAGRPVITTDVPGCRETVIDGENGFLIPPQNTGELVKKMIFFIENPEQIILMGKKSRERAEKEFCATTQAEKLFNMIVND